MRIISGSLKGRTLNPGKNFTARPTTDFAKSGLFNLLQNEVDYENLQVADLFAGSGSIGFEFISRGARNILFVDINAVHCAFIQSQIEKFSIQNGRVMKHDGYEWAKRNRRKFDLIFADPPYTDENINQLPDLILNHENLNSGGLFIIEHNSSHNFENHPLFHRTRNYGKVHFTFFKFN
jgi:16S rRNA (guanine(966)-N(2))-methyltransferase RsmD